MFQKISALMSKIDLWFNSQDRLHDIMRLGLGCTVMFLCNQVGLLLFGFTLWSIFVVVNEVRDMRKHGKQRQYLYKDTLYDLSWSYSGVALFCLFVGGFTTFLSALALILWGFAVFHWYDKEKRYE